MEAMRDLGVHAEDLVTRIVKEGFYQKIDAETIRTVAKVANHFQNRKVC